MVTAFRHLTEGTAKLYHFKKLCILELTALCQLWMGKDRQRYSDKYWYS